MDGARQFKHLFPIRKTVQHKRLAIYRSDHARGSTLNIYVLPKGVEAEGRAPWSIEDSVIVYDAVDGQRGWTESYGWLKKGPWCEDFEKLVKDLQKKYDLNKQKQLENEEKAKQKEKQREDELLADY